MEICGWQLLIQTAIMEMAPRSIYWNDPDTLFISFHQDGRTLYPGTGFIEEFGGPAAYGYNINIPLPPARGGRRIFICTG